MSTITSRCVLDVQRGPDWLLVRIKEFDPDQIGGPSLAARVCHLMEQHFTYRLVLELEQAPVLNSRLISQLLDLYRWVEERGGVMRVCGLSAHNREVLHACRLDEQLLPYRDRREAVMGGPHFPLPR
ncbi:MAG: STAS domain-containing protein [Thermoguttaceae bacterium]